MSGNRNQNLLVFVVIILIIALAFAYVKIENLESTIRNLRSDLNYSVSTLEDRVNSM